MVRFDRTFCLQSSADLSIPSFELAVLVEDLAIPDNYATFLLFALASLPARSLIYAFVIVDAVPDFPDGALVECFVKFCIARLVVAKRLCS